jgi:hypothetical protein
MANPRQAERDTIEASHEATRRAADQASQVGRTMSDAAENTARAGSEAFRRNAESIGRTWRKAAKRRRGLQSARWTNSPNSSGLAATAPRKRCSNRPATSKRSSTVLRWLSPASRTRPGNGCASYRIALKKISRPLRGASGLPHAARMHGASDTDRPRQS